MLRICGLVIKSIRSVEDWMLVDGFDLYRILKLFVATRSFCVALRR